MSAGIQAAGLTYTYPDGTKALDDVSFTVDPGESVALVGPSGAGKSTLAKCLVGFVFPQKGRIAVDGIEITPKTLKEIRKRVGLIFQDPDDQLFMPTLFDDVAFGLLQQGVRGEELERRVEKALADRNLEGLGRKFPGHLSGGQKRLAALAGVMVMEPEVLVLDEPSSNLDPRSCRNLVNQLNTLSNTRLIATHNLEFVLQACSRVIVLDQGEVVADGPGREVMSDREFMESHGLEKPHSLTPHQHRDT